MRYAIGFILLLLAGCHHPAATTRPVTLTLGLGPSTIEPKLRAIVAVPLGWELTQKDETSRHIHWTWTSPTGDSAFGAIYVRLALPIGSDLTLFGFMAEMRAKEGEGTVLSKQSDDSLPGLRFVAEGGKYKIRCNLINHGFDAWIFYAGTMRGKPERPDELELAERAREAAIAGLPQ